MKRHSLAATVLLLASLASWQCAKAPSSSKHPAAADSAASHDSAAAVQPDTVPAVRLSYEELQGRRLYSTYCTICHGDDGKGDGFNAYNLDPKPRDFTNKKYLDALSDAQMKEAISGGGRSVNKSPLMPSWGGRLQDRSIEYLVAYIRTFSR
jgi:mono/diheme cytochrome c family protein